MRYSSILLIALLFAGLGCNLNDSFDEEPMFIQVNSVDLVTVASQGEDTHAIRDVHVFVDGFSFGVFEVSPDRPARIPVISDNPTFTLDIFAGIRNSGLTFSPAMYPFFERNQFEVDFEPNTTLELDLEFEYKDNIVFSILEDFENTQIYSFDVDEDQDNALGTTSNPSEVLFGNKAARYLIDSENPVDFAQATTLFQTSMFGASQVYMEVDFKCDVPFIFGYFGFDEFGTLTPDFTIIVSPTETWTKLYLDLSADLNGGLFESFQLMVGGIPDVGDGTILFDNVKLVHQVN